MLLRAFAGTLIAAGALAAGTIHLKTRSIDTEAAPQLAPAGPRTVYRLHPDRRHVMVEFRTAWEGRLIAELRARGVAVVSALGTRALTLALSSGASLSGLPVSWTAEFAAGDKLSPELETAAGAAAPGSLVAFHEDVGADDIESILRRNRVSATPVNGLLPNQRFIHASLDALHQLAAWDEVAYIFPGAPNLLDSAGAKACGGALLQGVPQGLMAAQFVTEGAGWPANVPGGVALGYVFTTLPSQVPAPQVQSEIVRAMRQWSLITNVQFLQAANQAAPGTIAIEFGTSVNNDPTPFDPAGSVLAHTYYPAPPNPEPIAGDMHFNPAESWRVGATVDIYTVALHELGHALGLGHTDNPADVMYPYYRFGSQLSSNDIGGVQFLYGAPGVAAPPPGGGSGDTGDPVAPGAPLLVVIESPVNGLQTNAASASLSGTLVNAAGQAAVAWRSNNSAGAASGSSSWNTGPIPLVPGVNLITVTATEGASQRSSRIIRILRAGSN